MAEGEGHIIRNTVVVAAVGAVVGGVAGVELGIASGSTLSTNEIAGIIGAGMGCSLGINFGWLGTIYVDDIREWPARRRADREFRAAREQREANNAMVPVPVFDASRVHPRQKRKR